MISNATVGVQCPMLFFQNMPRNCSDSQFLDHLKSPELAAWSPISTVSPVSQCPNPHLFRSFPMNSTSFPSIHSIHLFISTNFSSIHIKWFSFLHYSVHISHLFRIYSQYPHSHQMIFYTDEARDSLEVCEKGRLLKTSKWYIYRSKHGDVLYSLVMTNIAVENHHVSWENPRFQWPCSIAMFN